jgi:hypothetical protein
LPSLEPGAYDHEAGRQAGYSEKSPQVDSYSLSLISGLCTTLGLEEEEIVTFDGRGITLQAQKAAY